MRRFVVLSVLVGAVLSSSVVSVVPASAATVNVYTAAQGGQPGFESSMAFTPTADPTLLAQLDNQQGSDADSTSYSQAFQIPTDGTVNTITWWGTGANQTGFMVAIHDGVWATPGVVGNLPNGPVVEGTLTNLSVLPIASVTQTPSINGETQYQIHIPSTAMYTSHAYRLSITAVGGSFERDTSSATGCCGGSQAIRWVRGRLQSYLAIPSVSFSLDNSASTATAPLVTSQPSKASVSVGQPSSFTAAASGSPAPTVQWQVSTNGGATFSDIAGATSATYSGIATLTDNANQLRAVFANGSGTATTNAAALTVNSPTAVAVTSTVPAPEFGQLTKLTATVTSPVTGTKKVSAGSVSIFDGAGLLASVPVKAGKASVTAAFGAGSHSIVAVYGGSGAVLTAQSAVLILPVGQAPTSVALVGPAKAKAGQPVTLAATVGTAAPAKSVATGVVAFREGVTVLATATLTAQGKATFTTSIVALGAHTITATFQGDANHASSSASRVITIS